MRTIKFRAWDKEYHLMTDTHMLRLSLIGELYVGSHNVTDYYELMQYTGLKDKNGKEIYEGDILKSKLDRGTGQEALGVVTYNEAIASFIALITDSNEEVYHYSQLNEGNVVGKPRLSYTEVIGNVWQNPELLEVQND